MLTKGGGKYGGRMPNPELRSNEVEFGRRPPDEADPGSPAKPDRMMRPNLWGRPRPGALRTHRAGPTRHIRNITERAQKKPARRILPAGICKPPSRGNTKAIY